MLCVIFKFWITNWCIKFIMIRYHYDLPHLLYSIMAIKVRSLITNISKIHDSNKNAYYYKQLVTLTPLEKIAVIWAHAWIQAQLLSVKFFYAFTPLLRHMHLSNKMQYFADKHRLICRITIHSMKFSISPFLVRTVYKLFILVMF